MGQFLRSFVLGLGQLFDKAVLRVLAKSLGVTLVIFALAAVLGWWALDWALAELGLGETLFAGGDGLRGVAAAALALLGLWLLWRIIAMAVIQFYAEDVVRAVEARHYPQAMQTARDLPLGQQLRQTGIAAGRALLFNLLAAPLALALVFTAIGPAIVFWLVNALLLGRELQDMVWLRHRWGSKAAAPVTKGQRFLLGGAVAALLTVPFVHFLAPVLGAACATHLVHRHKRAHNG